MSVGGEDKPWWIEGEGEGKKRADHQSRSARRVWKTCFRSSWQLEFLLLSSAHVSSSLGFSFVFVEFHSSYLCNSVLFQLFGMDDFTLPVCCCAALSAPRRSACLVLSSRLPYGSSSCHPTLSARRPGPRQRIRT